LISDGNIIQLNHKASITRLLVVYSTRILWRGREMTDDGCHPTRQMMVRVHFISTMFSRRTKGLTFALDQTCTASLRMKLCSTLAV